MQYILAYVVLVSTLLILSPGIAWGHGTDIDSSRVVEIGDKKIYVSTEITNVAGEEKIIIMVSERNSDKMIGDITLFVELYYDGNSLLHERFHAPEGVLRFVMETGEEPIKINGVLDEFSDVWSYGNDDEIILKGKGLGLKGLYTFEIAIEKVLWTDESLDDVEIFRTDVSVVEDITHVQHDSNGSSVKFETRSYFDIVTDFEYDYNEKRVYFQIPFDWDDKAISHIPVVHIEVRFPNNFTEFYSVGYTGTANGIDLFRSSVTIDDYTKEDYRIIHFVLLGDHLQYIKNIMEATDKVSDGIVFTLDLSDKIEFPLSATTRDEQFQIDLSWTPLEISQEEKTTFIFTIRDGATGEPLRHSSYDFIIIQSGQKTIGKDGTVWVAEHGEGGGIAAYNHVLGTLKRIPSPSYSALANSAVFDKYGNVWFAQHTIDNLAVYDPQSKATLTVPIPTNQSWVQFLASGSDDNIWFVEQKTNKLGKVTVSEGAPSGSAPQRQSQENTISLATVAGPLMAAGVIVASLFFVNAVHNKRESDLFYSKTDHSKST